MHHDFLLVFHGGTTDLGGTVVELQAVKVITTTIAKKDKNKIHVVWSIYTAAFAMQRG